jgi:hypothetical protein
LSTKKSKRLAEGKATPVEISILKCLSRAKLQPKELTMLEALTRSELLVEYGLQEHLARKVIEHVKQERQRMTFQSQYTPDEKEKGFEPGRGSYTRTSPIEESALKSKIRRLVEGHRGAIMMDMPMLNTPPASGRMFDYGMQASDSDEGRMFKQTLHRIIEDSQDLHELLTDRDDLPQWCHYKVAEAAAALSKVRDYLTYKVENPEEPWHH